MNVENIISLSSATLTTIRDVEQVMIIIRFPDSVFNL